MKQRSKLTFQPCLPLWFQLFGYAVSREGNESAIVWSGGIEENIWDEIEKGNEVLSDSPKYLDGDDRDYFYCTIESADGKHHRFLNIVFSPRKLAHELREMFALFVVQYSSLDRGRQRREPLHSSINNRKWFTAISFLAVALQVCVDPPAIENVLQAQTFLHIVDDTWSRKRKRGLLVRFRCSSKKSPWQTTIWLVYPISSRIYLF